MSTATEFVDGLIAKAPRDGAPEYVKACLSIRRAELIAWLSEREGDWVNVDIKEAKSGKWYAAVDAWKPDSRRQDKPKPQHGGGGGKPAPSGDFEDSSIPF